MIRRKVRRGETLFYLPPSSRWGRVEEPRAVEVHTVGPKWISIRLSTYDVRRFSVETWRGENQYAGTLFESEADWRAKTELEALWGKVSGKLRSTYHLPPYMSAEDLRTVARLFHVDIGDATP